MRAPEQPSSDVDNFTAYRGSEAPFDAVLMNPPFSLPGPGGARMDAQHVRAALSMVGRGGTLVALMSQGSDSPTDAPRRALHDALASGWRAQWYPLEAGGFRMSGTDVPTVLLVAERVA
jgi:predicted RNA methylase